MIDPNSVDEVRAGSPCAGCGAIGRREFVSLSVFAAAAAALAGCAPADNPTAPTSVNLTVRVADYSTLANVGGIATLRAGGSPIAIVRTADATFVALSRVCPHQGGTVQPDGSGGFNCPVHGARFSATGSWIGGQRTSSLRTYATSYDSATGVLTVG